VLQVFLV
ncbi:PTS system fructose-specific transporter subunits IIBC, partial [Haemophilus influenzae]